MTKQLNKVIKYVDGLEKAYALIDSNSTSELYEFEYRLKKVNEELGFIIEDIDYKFRKEFYGEGE
tara:strand:- start:142 stop:336 length:195 start_codon:yes stop_codon:yes gene_type:complete